MSRPLFLGERKKKRVQVRGIHHLRRRRDTDVQAALYIMNGQVLPGVHVYDGGKNDGMFVSPVAMMSPSHKSGDLIAAYRTYLLIEAATALDADVLIGALVAPMSSLAGCREVAKQLAALREQVPAGSYEAILTSVPPNLEGILIGLVAVEELTLDDDHRSAITDEIAAGRLTLTPGLRQIGVQSPEERDRRQQERVVFLGTLIPHFQAYLEKFRYACVFGQCSCTDTLSTMAVSAREMGIKEAYLQVGLACFVHHSTVARGGGFRGSVRRGSLRCMREIAQFLAERFGAETGHDASWFLGELLNVAGQWGNKDDAD